MDKRPNTPDIDASETVVRKPSHKIVKSKWTVRHLNKTNQKQFLVLRKAGKHKATVSWGRTKLGWVLKLYATNDI